MLKFKRHLSSPLVFDQTVFMAMLAAGVFVATMVVVGIISIFTEIEISAWEIVGSIAPWYIAFISGWLAHDMTTTFIAHGKTRAFAFREWLTTGAVMTVAGSMLMALGYVFERVIYNIADFPGHPGEEHIFGSAYELHLVILEFLMIFAVWFALGGFAGIALYTSDDNGWLGIPAALILAAVSGTWSYGGVGVFGVVKHIFPSIGLDTLWVELPMAAIVAAIGIYLMNTVLKSTNLRNP